MPSSNLKKVPANVGKRTQPGGLAQSRTLRDDHMSTQATTGSQRPSSGPEYQEQLSDALMEANTKLNKVLEDRDKLKILYSQATKELAESARGQQALFRQNEHLKEQLQRMTEENNKLQYDVVQWEDEFEKLENAYQTTELQLRAVSATAAGSPAALPERPKSSRGPPGKKEHRQSRDSAELREERGRPRDRERDRGVKEQKAEKERLIRRFDDKPRPPTANRRGSFIEPWGPTRGRSMSANPAGRLTSAATGRMQVPTSPTSRQPNYSAIPRTANPMGQMAYGTNAAAYDKDFEPGDYRAYPIAR